MKSGMKLAIAGLLMLGVVAGLVPTAEATCTAPALVRMNNSVGDLSHIWTPGHFAGGSVIATAFALNFNNGVSYYYGFGAFVEIPAAGTITPMTPDARAVFWMLGNGDPSGNVTGRGGQGSDTSNTDHGAFFPPILQRPNNLYAGYGINYPGYVNTSWNISPLIDGCPTEDAEGDLGDLQFGNCLCLLITDQFNGDSYFAIAGNTIAPAGSTDLNRTTQTGNMAGLAPVFRDNLNMAQIPQARVTGSTKINNSQVDVSVHTPAVAGGVYNRGGCACQPTGFRVHQRNFANATLNQLSPDAEPNDHPSTGWAERDIAAGSWSAVSPLTPMGGTVVVNASCVGDESVFLASQMCFANGGAGDFCTPVVGRSAVEVECGANLATPPGPGRGKGKGKGRGETPGLTKGLEPN